MNTGEMFKNCLALASTETKSGAHLELVPHFLFLSSYIKFICTFVYLIIRTIHVYTFHFFLSFSFSFIYF